MPVSNDIFELVKAMTRKEKSFFRRYFRLIQPEKMEL